MKGTTRVTLLTRLTTAMSVAAPLVVFGFLYVLQVQPERAAALEALERLDVERRAVDRRRMFVVSPASVNTASTIQEFVIRTPEGDRAADVADALTAMLNSPAVGGVSNLSIETGVPSDAPIDSMVGRFSRKVMQTPVTVAFDARYEQIGRFFWNLRMLPTTFDLQSVELEPATRSRTATMRAKATLLAFHRPVDAPVVPVPQPHMVDVVTAPQWRRDPFAAGERADAVKAVTVPAPPEPVVRSILFSSGRRVALVDGRVVGAGDRLRSGVVRSIEPDAVVIAAEGGRERRVEIQRPVIHMARRSCVLSPCVPM